METLPAITRPDFARDLIKQIAMDIGKDTVAYIEWMYPEAIEATSSTFRLSIRNHIYNQIMAAIEVNEEGQILDRLESNRKHRRKMNKLQKLAKEAGEAREAGKINEEYVEEMLKKMREIDGEKG